MIGIYAHIVQIGLEQSNVCLKTALAPEADNGVLVTRITHHYVGQPLANFDSRLKPQPAESRS